MCRCHMRSSNIQNKKIISLLLPTHNSIHPSPHSRPELPPPPTHNTHTHTHTHIYIYIYIYIEREREREREFTINLIRQQTLRPCRGGRFRCGAENMADVLFLETKCLEVRSEWVQAVFVSERKGNAIPCSGPKTKRRGNQQRKVYLVTWRPLTFR